MIGAAKRKSISPPVLTALWTILLLVVTLCLGQARVWGFAVTPQPASGIFAPANPLSIGENYDGWQYEASDSLLAAKGGVGPVLQGQAGVARAIGEYEAAGVQVLGREISLRAGGGLTRPDFYGQSAQGFREFIEVKNGASAALNPNQARLFPIVQQSGAVPVGANAARAGLPPGVPILPTHVRVITYP